MPATLYWMQGGGCGGDSMSLLGAESPDLLELLSALDVEVLWHPSMSNGSPSEHAQLRDRIISGEQELDFLCVEGAVIRGPSGTGMYDVVDGRPRKDLLAQMAHRARHILAIGTCASFGGIGAGCESEACGLQYLRWEKGGFLGADFVSRGGTPVINLPGCPCHCDVITNTLATLADGGLPKLGDYNAPVAWYGILVHQGCTRNEYHEYRVEEQDFGGRGCLFFHMGCHGPLAYGPCNKVLWNRRSSKTRVGVPCFGCTRPDFPQEYPFFETRNIEGIPHQLPDGVDRAHYLAYKGMAAAAAPERLEHRQTRV
ncbi:MAG: NADH:ubiquinone oxidoreductase [Phycisphaerae bacterium]|nr:NADH:ubiquinone oxidoreductase [Phycisphaerae bacterium]